MFLNSTNLIGGAGTKYDSTKTDKTYARIDKGTSAPGYLTVKWFEWDSSTGTLTLKGQLPSTYKEYSTLPELAGIESDDVKKIVITEGTKTGQSAEAMFYEISNLTSIEGLTNLNTSKATDMDYMFFWCQSLTSLDVSGFDTSGVTSMYCMFDGLKNLTGLKANS